MLFQHGFEQLCQLVVVHVHQVLVVEPLALLEVEFGALARTVVDGKFLDELVHREHLAVVTGIPAQQGEEVDHGLRQVTGLTVAAGVLTALGVVPVQREHGEAQAVAVALAQLALAVRLEQQRQVNKCGHGVLPAEGLIQQHVQWCTGQPLLAADDMRHLHQVVINDVGQVIGGQIVGALVEHLVIENR